jgi:hypothetical protein
MPENSQLLIQVPAIVQNMNPKADRSWKLVFETRELSGDEVKILADNFQGEGWLVFKPNSEGISQKEIPVETADAGMKTPSQRLRASIMVWYKQSGAKGDPEAFYRTTMEKLIEYVQSKIPEEG